MSSIQLGPFMFDVRLFILVVSFIGASITAALCDRKYKSGAENVLFWGLVCAIVVGRLAYVINHWTLYSQDILAALDVRDGGISVVPAIASGLAYYAWRVWRSRQLGRPLALSVGLGLLLAAVLHLVLQSGDSLKNQEFPDLTLHPVASQAQADSLAQFRGKPTVVNLWASWCGPCRREMPAFKQAQEENPQFNFVFLNQGESTALIDRFLHDEGLQLQHVYRDPEQKALAASRSVGLPTTIFLDAAGKMVDIRAGELSLPSLRARMQQMQP